MKLPLVECYGANKKTRQRLHLVHYCFWLRYYVFAKNHLQVTGKQTAAFRQPFFLAGFLVQIVNQTSTLPLLRRSNQVAHSDPP